MFVNQKKNSGHCIGGEVQSRIFWSCFCRSSLVKQTACTKEGLSRYLSRDELVLVTTCWYLCMWFNVTCQQGVDQRETTWLVVSQWSGHLYWNSWWTRWSCWGKFPHLLAKIEEFWLPVVAATSFQQWHEMIGCLIHCQSAYLKSNWFNVGSGLIIPLVAYHLSICVALLCQLFIPRLVRLRWLSIWGSEWHILVCPADLGTHHSGKHVVDWAFCLGGDARYSVVWGVQVVVTQC